MATEGVGRLAPSGPGGEGPCRCHLHRARDASLERIHRCASQSQRRRRQPLHPPLLLDPTAVLHGHSNAVDGTYFHPLLPDPTAVLHGHIDDTWFNTPPPPRFSSTVLFYLCAKGDLSYIILG